MEAVGVCFSLLFEYSCHFLKCSITEQRAMAFLFGTMAYFDGVNTAVHM